METNKTQSIEQYEIDQSHCKVIFNKDIIYWMFDDNGIINYNKESFYIPLSQVSAITYGKVRKIRYSILVWLLVSILLLISSITDDITWLLVVSLISIFVLIFFVFKKGRFLTIKSSNHATEIIIGWDASKSTQIFIEAVVKKLSEKK